MRTAGDIAQRALVRAGVLASGETPTAAEMQDAVSALADMLDSWRIEQLMAPGCAYARDESTVMSLPNGWQQAILLNLAVNLCGEYGFAVDPALASLANTAKANVKRSNIQPAFVTFDQELL
ncbi:MAG: packaged DNA stabilization gp4 family protein [Burkholderiaceae bacterium]